MKHKLILTLIGLLLLAGGLAMAVIAPLEMVCFLLFSEGGRFYFEGFGFGSLVFAIIAWQVIAYDFIALVCVPLGYGHVRRRSWARPLTLTALWSWLIVGAPLSVVIWFMAISFKNPSQTMGLFVLPLLGFLIYPVLPVILIRFYNSEAVKRAFEPQDSTSNWIHAMPIPILMLGFLFVFYLIVLHIPFFFNGIFPLFGTWANEMQGMLVADGAILCLAWLTWGTLRRKAWAWWGDVVYFGLLTTSVIVTLVQSSLGNILAMTHLAPLEIQAFQNVPLQGWHLAMFIGIPLIATLGLILFSRPHFREFESDFSQELP